MCADWLKIVFVIRYSTVLAMLTYMARAKRISFSKVDKFWPFSRRGHKKGTSFYPYSTRDSGRCFVEEASLVHFKLIETR